MQNVASDLLLLTTNLSQLKNRDRILELFIESICAIFPGYSFKWFSDDVIEPDLSLAVCTRSKTYGYLLFERDFSSDKELYALFSNASQLLAILLERLEQDELLGNQKEHLQHLVDEQTNYLFEKQDELNEMNEEFSTLNEELVKTNKWLLTLNENLQSEIADHKKAEEELRQSEEKFKNVFEHASVGKSITSIDGNLKVNQAFCDILGYLRDELSSKKWQDITHPEDIEYNQQMLQSILMGEKKSADWQKRYIHKNGNIVWATISTSLQRDDKGKPLFYITTVNDITIQKLMQEELLYSEQLFSNVFYNSPVSITITSRGDGKIVEANKTFLNNMEFTRDEVVGKSIMELGIFYNPAIREKLIDGLIKNGFVSDFECSFRSKTGKVSVGLMSMSFIQYKGKPHQLTTVIDITERKKAENELEYSHNRLEEAQKIAKIGNWEANLVTGELYWSEEIFNIFGFNSKSYNPSVNAFYTAVHTDDRDKVLESEKLSEQTGLHDVVHRIVRPTGEIRFVHELARRYSDENGNLIMLQGTVQDITELKQAEEELKNKEILLNLTGKMAKVGGWEFDVSTMQQTWTEEVYHIHEVGLDFDQNVEKGINFYAPGSKDIIEKAVQRAIEFGEPYDLELELITFKGNHRWVHSIGNAYQENGKTKKVFGSFQDITESKLAEIKLRDNERLLNESQRISGIGSYVLDIISGTWSGSDFLNEMFGIDKSDDHSLEGMVSMIHPGDQVMITSYFINHVIGKKERFEKEFRFFTPKVKQIRWMHAIGELEFDLRGNPIKMFGTIRDITNRKLIEIELNDYERLLNESQRISGIGSYILDIVSGTWSGSLFLNEMFGINESDDHSVEGWLSVIHPDDQAAMASYFTNEVIGKKGRFDKEYRIVAKNTKQERWVHGVGELELNKEGYPIRMIGTIRDNTERKKVDDELRKLLRAVEQSPDSIIITNEKGDIEYANPAILKLTGYSNEELIGKNPRIFSSGEKTKEEYKILWDTIGSGNVWQGEFHNKKKNGELYWESATISPVVNDLGKITHYLAIREDVTEKKKLAFELIEAKEHAEESDRLKSSFLANMSHEIRTPMNSIMGFASLLPEEKSRDLMCQYANIIVQNSEQLVSLIDGIVMYSKLQTGLFMYRPVLFLAHNLFNDIQQSFNLPVFQKGVALKFVYKIGETTQIYSDYDKLRQIITNLTVNAFKYTHKGEITLGCDHNGDCFEFYVKDSGIGIPQKDIPHIFERFYRGSNIDEAISRGTGLGLCIVKELVEMLGGNIWVESEEGKGSTFYFTIPLTK